MCQNTVLHCDDGIVRLSHRFCWCRVDTSDTARTISVAFHGMSDCIKHDNCLLNIVFFIGSDETMEVDVLPDQSFRALRARLRTKARRDGLFDTADDVDWVIYARDAASKGASCFLLRRFFILLFDSIIGAID